MPSQQRQAPSAAPQSELPQEMRHELVVPPSPEGLAAARDSLVEQQRAQGLEAGLGQMAARGELVPGEEPLQTPSGVKDRVDALWFKVQERGIEYFSTTASVRVGLEELGPQLEEELLSAAQEQSEAALAAAQEQANSASEPPASEEGAEAEREAEEQGAEEGGDGEGEETSSGGMTRAEAALKLGERKAEEIQRHAESTAEAVNEQVGQLPDQIDRWVDQRVLALEELVQDEEFAITETADEDLDGKLNELGDAINQLAEDAPRALEGVVQEAIDLYARAVASIGEEIAARLAILDAAEANGEEVMEFTDGGEDGLASGGYVMHIEDGKLVVGSRGGEDNDTFVYDANGKPDELVDLGGERDTLVLTGVESWDDVQFVADGDDMVLEFAQGGKLIIRDWANEGGIERIQLAEKEGPHLETTLYKGTVDFIAGQRDRYVTRGSGGDLGSTEDMVDGVYQEEDWGPELTRASRHFQQLQSEGLHDWSEAELDEAFDEMFMGDERFAGRRGEARRVFQYFIKKQRNEVAEALGEERWMDKEYRDYTWNEDGDEHGLGLRVAQNEQLGILTGYNQGGDEEQHESALDITKSAMNAENAPAIMDWWSALPEDEQQETFDAVSKMTKGRGLTGFIGLIGSFAMPMLGPVAAAAIGATSALSTAAITVTMNAGFTALQGGDFGQALLTGAATSFLGGQMGFDPLGGLPDFAKDLVVSGVSTGLNGGGLGEFGASFLGKQLSASNWMSEDMLAELGPGVGVLDTFSSAAANKAVLDQDIDGYAMMQGALGGVGSYAAQQIDFEGLFQDDAFYDDDPEWEQRMRDELAWEQEVGDFEAEPWDLERDPFSDDDPGWEDRARDELAWEQAEDDFELEGLSDELGDDTVQRLVRELGPQAVADMIEEMGPENIGRLLSAERARMNGEAQGEAEVYSEEEAFAPLAELNLEEIELPEFLQTDESGELLPGRSTTYAMLAEAAFGKDPVKYAVRALDGERPQDFVAFLTSPEGADFRSKLTDTKEMDRLRDSMSSEQRKQFGLMLTGAGMRADQEFGWGGSALVDDGSEAFMEKRAYVDSLKELSLGWSESTAIAGMTPYGHHITDSFSVDSRTMTSMDQGYVMQHSLWTDMGLPANMWSWGANVARYSHGRTHLRTNEGGLLRSTGAFTDGDNVVATNTVTAHEVLEKQQPTNAHPNMQGSEMTQERYDQAKATHSEGRAPNDRGVYAVTYEEDDAARAATAQEGGEVRMDVDGAGGQAEINEGIAAAQVDGKELDDRRTLDEDSLIRTEGSSEEQLLDERGQGRGPHNPSLQYGEGVDQIGADGEITAAQVGDANGALESQTRRAVLNVVEGSLAVLDIVDGVTLLDEAFAGDQVDWIKAVDGTAAVIDGSTILVGFAEKAGLKIPIVAKMIPGAQAVTGGWAISQMTVSIANADSRYWEQINGGTDAQSSTTLVMEDVSQAIGGGALGDVGAAVVGGAYSLVATPSVAIANAATLAPQKAGEVLDAVVGGTIEALDGALTPERYVPPAPDPSLVPLQQLDDGTNVYMRQETLGTGEQMIEYTLRLKQDPAGMWSSEIMYQGQTYAGFHELDEGARGVELSTLNSADFPGLEIPPAAMLSLD